MKQDKEYLFNSQFLEAIFACLVIGYVGFLIYLLVIGYYLKAASLFLVPFVCKIIYQKYKLKYSWKTIFKI